MPAVFANVAAHRTRCISTIVLVIALVSGGCVESLAKLKHLGHKSTCNCSEVCDCEGRSSSGIHCSKCGHLQRFGHVSCERCGYFLHFCVPPDYVGPIEPPPHPRFHPIPTGPVYAVGAAQQ